MAKRVSTAKMIQFGFSEEEMTILAAMKKRGGASTLAGVVRELVRTGHVILQHLEQGFELQLVKDDKVKLIFSPLFYFASVRVDEEKGK